MVLIEMVSESKQVDKAQLIQRIDYKIEDIHKQIEQQEFNQEVYLDIYKQNLLNPMIFYLVYEEKNEVIGFISIHIQRLLHHISSIAEIQELIVDEKVRAQGIDGQLFEKAKRIARENGCTQLEVCCNQRRKESHKFYEGQEMKNSHYKFCLEL